MSRAALASCCLIGLGTAGAPARADWLQYAAVPARNAVAAGGPRDLRAALWTATEHPVGTPIVFEGPTSPVVLGDRVYANARHVVGGQHVNNKLVCVNRLTGEVAWATLIAAAVADSWSSPAVDASSNVVILGSGSFVYGIDAADGAIRWSTPLPRPIVNSSAAVTDDLPHARALITDYSAFATDGALYCINLVPFDSDENPFLPGDVVWQETIGQANGNTPAYHAGVVYVTAGFGAYPMLGLRVRAYDVSGAPGRRLLWNTELFLGEPEYLSGGIAYVDGHLYAASYDFSGPGDTARLMKLDAATGTIQWSVPCNRTSSIPVVDGDRIYLSTGISGFGSGPRVQAFDDLGVSAVKVWDTYADTGGALVVGGWSHQPVLSGGVLYAGKIPQGLGQAGAYTDLFMLNVSRSPADPEFILDHRSGVGGSPAVSHGRVYTIGAGGLASLAARGDFSGDDGVVNGADVAAFARALVSPSPTAQEIALGDFTGDEQLAFDDVAGFVARALGG